MITIEHDRNDYLVCRASGTLAKSDYDAAIPELENALKLRDGDVNLMVVLENFTGWQPGALLKELNFDARHRKDFGKIAVLGQSGLEEWGTWISKPFFASEVRYFDLEDRELAEAWLTESAGDRPAGNGDRKDVEQR